MNKLTLLISTAAIGSLFSAGTASADFQGVSWDLINTAWGDTYRVYADIDAGGEVDAVYGDAGNALLIETSNGGAFYQNMFGGATSQDINTALFGMFPSLEYDSFVTIGLLDNTGNALMNIGIDWTAFEAGGSITTSNGSWFATPADAQVHDPGDGRVLIGQFTVAVGDGVHGIINLQGKDAGGANWTATQYEFDTSLVPAPGAFALLGLAGIAARRRRK